MLSQEQVQHNLTNYIEQIAKILDIEKLEIRYNSEWLSTLSFDILAEIANIFSVNEMLDRDNFSQRHKNHTRISLREFLYPLIQKIIQVDMEKVPYYIFKKLNMLKRIIMMLFNFIVMYVLYAIIFILCL